MKRKYGIVFGAVAIVLLMVSTVTAVPEVQSEPVMVQLENNETLKNQLVNINNELNIVRPSATTVTTHVEQGIHIDGTQKRFLRDALPFVDDQDVHDLLQKIVNKPGPVYSRDIEQILKDNPDIEINTITLGSITTFVEVGHYYGTSGGSVFVPRRPLCAFCVFCPFVIRIDACYQPSIGTGWPYPVQLAINREIIYTDAIVVWALGLLGWARNEWATDPGFQCNIIFAPLIIY